MPGTGLTQGHVDKWNTRALWHPGDPLEREKGQQCGQSSDWAGRVRVRRRARLGHSLGKGPGREVWSGLSERGWPGRDRAGPDSLGVRVFQATLGGDSPSREYRDVTILRRKVTPRFGNAASLRVESRLEEAGEGQEAQ